MEGYLKALEDTKIKIGVYRNYLIKSYCPFKKSYYEERILKKIDDAQKIISTFCMEMGRLQMDFLRQQTNFTIEELAGFNGLDGKPAYVAVNGIVYDVSLEPTWAGASHFGILAGRDVTAQFSQCHKAIELLLKLPRVGTLKQ